jgi:ribosomal protein S18 acetylase RimI-like enzyme
VSITRLLSRDRILVPLSLGVASDLMRTLEAWAKDAGARAVLLDTHLTNADARSLYGALGYREVGVILLKEI